MAFEYKGDFTEPEFTVIPPNTEVLAIFTEAAEEDNREKNGTRVKVTVQVVEGEFKGRTFFDGYNINSTAGKDYSVDERRLARVCVILLGKPSYRNISEIKNKPLRIVIGTKPGFGDKADKVYNCIKQTEPKNGTFKELTEGRKSAPVVDTHSTITSGYGQSIDPDFVPF